MPNEQQYSEMENASYNELYRYISNESAHSQTRLLAETELRKRESRKMVDSTNRLVHATWGLVIVTAILTLVTFSQIFLNK